MSLHKLQPRRKNLKSVWPPGIQLLQSTLHVIEIKQVENFKYLGCNVNTNGTIEEEIIRRIAKYSLHVGMMYRLLKDRNVPRKVKLVIHKTILMPILLYWHEFCVTTQLLDSRIQAADMKVLRLIKGVIRRDKIRNADYEEFHIKPILDVIREGKFRWLGHALRREPPSIIHEVVNYKVKMKRPRGRPRTTWLKSMDNLLKEKGFCMKDVMSQNLYQDRRAWRTLFVDWQEFIFLIGEWLERDRAREICEIIVHFSIKAWHLADSYCIPQGRL